MSKYFQPFTLLLTHEEQYYLDELSKERQCAKDSLIAHLIKREYELNKRKKEGAKNV